MTIEEQYALLPKLMVYVSVYRNLGVTAEDVEDAAQEIITYVWQTGREVSIQHMFRMVRQRLFLFVAARNALKRGGGKRAELSDKVDHSQRVEDVVMARDCIREICTREWGRNLIKFHVGLDGKDLKWNKEDRRRRKEGKEIVREYRG